MNLMGAANVSKNGGNKGWKSGTKKKQLDEHQVKNIIGFKKT